MLDANHYPLYDLRVIIFFDISLDQQIYAHREELAALCEEFNFQVTHLKKDDHPQIKASQRKGKTRYRLEIAHHQLMYYVENISDMEMSYLRPFNMILNVLWTSPKWTWLRDQMYAFTMFSDYTFLVAPNVYRDFQEKFSTFFIKGIPDEWVDPREIDTFSFADAYTYDAGKIEIRTPQEYLYTSMTPAVIRETYRDGEALSEDESIQWYLAPKNVRGFYATDGIPSRIHDFDCRTMFLFKCAYLPKTTMDNACYEIRFYLKDIRFINAVEYHDFLTELQMSFHQLKEIYEEHATTPLRGLIAIHNSARKVKEKIGIEPPYFQ